MIVPVVPPTTAPITAPRPVLPRSLPTPAPTAAPAAVPIPAPFTALLRLPHEESSIELASTATTILFLISRLIYFIISFT